MPNLVIYAIENDIVIINSQGLCVSSSAPARIGEIMDMEKIKSLNKVFLDADGALSLYYNSDDYSERELALIKSLAKATYEQYLQESSRPTGTIDQFISEIVAEPPNNHNLGLFEKTAQSFGLNLEVKRVAILIEIKNFSQENLSLPNLDSFSREEIINDWKGKIVQSLSSFFTVKSDVIPTFIGHDRFVLFKEVGNGEEKFVKNMKTSYASIFSSLVKIDDLAISFSTAHSGIRGLREAFFEAIQAMELGRKFSKNKNRVFYYGDLGTLRILTEENVEKKKQFAKEILDPLDKETLRVTLEIFFNENMDIKRTAIKLKVHPNTVNYRISKIAQELGLNPKIFKQAFELRIALLTDQIFK